MKSLLTAIKDELSGIAETHIVRHENYLPPTARTPAIGIKDGLITRREMMGGGIEYTMQVLVVVWVQLLETTDASIVGSGELDGVLDLAASVIDTLDNNLLSVNGMQHAFATECRASEPMGVNTTTLQRKIIVMRYIRETEGTCGT